jgi:integrase/recombinase XerD
MNKLSKFLREYLSVRRQLGYDLKRVEAMLLSFISFLKKKKAYHITNQLALEFATANSRASPSWQSRRLGVIRQFASYLHTFDARTEIPSKELLPFSYHRRPPYIFTDSDITNLLETFQSSMAQGAMEAHAYFVLFGLIAVTGMRTGEALALKNNSVDLSRGIITINESKYKKSRKIPIHSSVLKILRKYSRCKDKHLRKKASDYFFVNIRGTKLNKTDTYHAFRKAYTLSGIGKDAKYRPRIVDLRHRFAIKTLVNCYRRRINPETVIPTLSMYLGHENPKHTYWYLTATEELMSLIGKRIEEKFGGNV